MKRLPITSAFTVAELMISLAVGALALVAAVSAAVSMQRCVVAGEEFAADKTEQTRLSDYLALDLRRAITVQGPVGNDLLTVTIPNFYEASGDPRTPTIVKMPDLTYVAQYDANPVTVVYSKDNATITRKEGNGTPVVIAQNVADFECAIDGIGLDKFVRTRISFVPSFQRGTPSAATKAATTLHNTIRLRNYK